MLPSQGSLRECVFSGESKIRVLNSCYIFLLRITARRIFLKQVSPTGIVFWELSCHFRLFLTVRDKKSLDRSRNNNQHPIQQQSTYKVIHPGRKLKLAGIGDNFSWDRPAFSRFSASLRREKKKLSLSNVIPLFELPARNNWNNPMFHFRGDGKGANCLRTLSRQLF